MSHDATERMLAAPDINALRGLVRERIQGKAGRPAGEDWRFTDAVERAAMRAQAEPLRARLVGAIQGLLQDLVDDPQRDLGECEWPAGLLYIARRTLWTDAERECAQRALTGLLYHALKGGWPIGRSTAPGLGSPTLELFRTSWFIGIDASFYRGAQKVSIERLLQLTERDADWELGALLGMLASCGDEEAREAGLVFRRLDNEQCRDRVLFAMDREHAGLRGSSTEVIKALLTAAGGSSDAVSLATAPSQNLQRWAAAAVLRLGALPPEMDQMRERLRNISPDRPRAPRPGFAKGLPSAPRAKADQAPR